MEKRDWKKEERKESPHKAWASGKKPSMKRRCEQHDYRDRGIYMITMAIEGRKPLLGSLRGKPDAERDEDKPHIVLTPWGEKVRECWMSIPKYHPVVEPVKLCIMPDHIHGILFVHKRMEKHLGQVIEGFKIGTRKAAKELGMIGENAALLAQPTGQGAQGGRQGAQGGRKGAVPISRHTAAGRAHGILWESGYNDRILLKKGQYERMKAYLDDNPRRLLIKRLHPEYFSRLGTITAAGIPMQAMGNRFLLDNPVKIQIQCSRRMTAEEIEHYQEAILERAKSEGAIVVSPCISPGEQQTATAAMAAGIPLIVLLLNGLPPLFKPQPRYLDACTEGRLLILAPFPYQNEKLEHMRQRCLQLNAYAAEICKED